METLLKSLIRFLKKSPTPIYYLHEWVYDKRTLSINDGKFLGRINQIDSIIDWDGEEIVIYLLVDMAGHNMWIHEHNVIPKDRYRERAK